MDRDGSDVDMTIESDIKGIKAGMRFLIERCRDRDVSEAGCDVINQHGSTREDADKAEACVIRSYNKLLKDLS